MQLADTGLGHPHHLTDFTKVKLLLVIERHHQLFAFRQTINCLDQGLFEVLIFENSGRVRVVIREVPFQKIFITITGEVLEIDNLMSTCVLQGLLVFIK